MFRTPMCIKSMIHHLIRFHCSVHCGIQPFPNVFQPKDGCPWPLTAWFIPTPWCRSCARHSSVGKNMQERYTVIVKQCQKALNKNNWKWNWIRHPWIIEIDICHELHLARWRLPSQSHIFLSLLGRMSWKWVVCSRRSSQLSWSADIPSHFSATRRVKRFQRFQTGANHSQPICLTWRWSKKKQEATVVICCKEPLEWPGWAWSSLAYLGVFRQHGALCAMWSFCIYSM